MPRTCTVCSSPKREEIERALLAGEPLRDIAGRVPVAKSALHRHKGHVSATLERAAKKQEEARGDRLLNQLLDLQRRTMELLTEAEQDGDRRTRLGAIREARSNLELIGRFLGELSGGETNINLVSVNIDEATGRRLAETYLSRHRAGLLEPGNAE
jgi:hypothetical protein